MAGNPSPFVQAFACPKCGAPQQLRSFGQSTAFYCERCGAMIDLTKDPYTVIGTCMGDVRPDIEIGKRGKFGEDPFEVIGFMVRCDSTGCYPWREYLLFNPYKGYRWLTEMNGHWNFVVPVKYREEEVSRIRPGVRFQGRIFNKFLVDSAKVKYVRGEFYWQVRVGDKTGAVDYISPPYILSKEYDESEVNFSLGVYINAAEVQRAFDLKDEEMPVQREMSPTQPGICQESAGFIYKWTAVFAWLLTILHVALISSASNERVLTSPFQGIPGIQKTEPFYLKGDGNVRLGVNAPVENSWIEAGLTLVNMDTQEDYEDSVEVSYYYGSDSDGPWVEGSQLESTVVGPVPAGNYYLTFEPFFDPSKPPPPSPMKIYVYVERNVSYNGNFWAALILLCMPALVLFLVRMPRESQRWQMADLGGGE